VVRRFVFVFVFVDGLVWFDFVFVFVFVLVCFVEIPSEKWKRILQFELIPKRSARHSFEIVESLGTSCVRQSVSLRTLGVKLVMG
jgi:hypothetical protein